MRHISLPCVHIEWQAVEKLYGGFVVPPKAQCLISKPSGLCRLAHACVAQLKRKKIEDGSYREKESVPLVSDKPLTQVEH